MGHKSDEEAALKGALDEIKLHPSELDLLKEMHWQQIKRAQLRSLEHFARAWYGLIAIWDNSLTVKGIYADEWAASTGGKLFAFRPRLRGNTQLHFILYWAGSL
jgi:hypothetical protein